MSIHSAMTSVLAMILLFFFAHTASATSWSDSTEILLADVRRQPQLVLNQLSNTAALSGEALVIRYYIISRANGALALNEKAKASAEAGLSLLSSDDSALYHYLVLAQAEALDGLGQAQAVIDQASHSLSWAREQKDDRLLNYALSVNGYLHITLNQYSEALAMFQEGYQRLSEPQGMFSRADFASMIALVYEYRQEPELTAQFYGEAEAWYRQHDIKLDLANTLYGLGKTSIAAGDSKKGIELLEESASIANNISDLQGAAFSYEAIGAEMTRTGKYDAAMPYLSRALVLFTQAGNPFMQIKVLIEEAHIAIELSRPEQAAQYLDTAASLAVGDSFLSQRIAIAESRARVHALNGQHQSAYTLLLQNRQNRAILQKEINSKRMLELQAQFDVEQQQARNALLEEQNLRQLSQLQSEQHIQRFTIVVVILLCLVCILLTWLYLNGKQHQQRLEQLANFDSLTGLLTRRKTMENAEQQYQLAHRHQTELTAAVIDLDHFKTINDTFGHQTGDDALAAFGDCAQNHFRKTDVLGRIGGEEFLFLFPHTDAGSAEELLHRFADKIRELPLRLKEPELNLTLSMGLVKAEHYRSLAQVIAQADEALYEAKRTGRDKIVIGKYPDTEQSC